MLSSFVSWDRLLTETTCFFSDQRFPKWAGCTGKWKSKQEGRVSPVEQMAENMWSVSIPLDSLSNNINNSKQAFRMVFQHLQRETVCLFDRSGCILFDFNSLLPFSYYCVRQRKIRRLSCLQLFLFYKMKSQH